MCQRIAGGGEGRNCELAECAMRRSVSVRTYGGADEETVGDMMDEETGAFSKKRGGRREKKGRFARNSTSFYSASPHSRKTKHFSHKIFDYPKLNPHFALDKTRLSLHHAALRRPYSAKSMNSSRPSGANAL